MKLFLVILILILIIFGRIMCNSPITIYTRAKYINRDFSPVRYQVPCGHCLQCQKDKVNGYFVRSYYEYKSTLEKGGFGYFDTLTYNDQYLPHFVISDINGPVLDLACFDHTDLNHFFKNLRNNIAYCLLSKCGYSKLLQARAAVKSNIRYFVTCEYGEDNHRPHYHLAFFCTVPGFTVMMLKHCINLSWVKYEHDSHGDLIPILNPHTGKKMKGVFGKTMYKCQRLGFTDSWSNTLKHVINSTSALQYITDYVWKDDIYLKEYIPQVLKDYTTEDGYVYNKDPKVLNPFHHSSINFGISYISDSHNCNYNSIHIQDCGKKYDFNVPLYYKRKLYFQVEKDPRDNKIMWIRNKLGITKRAIELVNSVQDRASQIYDWFSSDLIQDNEHNLDYLDFLLKGRSLVDYATYEVFYKDHFRGDIVCSPMDLAYLLPDNTYCDTFNPLSDPDISSEEKSSVIKDYRFHCHSSLSSKAYHGFDIISSLVEDYEKFVNISAENRLKAQRDNKRSIKFLKSHYSYAQ